MIWRTRSLETLNLVLISSSIERLMRYSSMICLSLRDALDASMISEMIFVASPLMDVDVLMECSDMERERSCS